MGSVTPLLAIYEELKKDENLEFFWVGTKKGVEEEIVLKEGIEFKGIFSGKLRRYFSWRNFTDIFLLVLGILQSILIMFKQKPDLIMSAGGFVSVPVVWAAWFFRVPILIHEQDARPGLANKLMAPFAKVITVTFEKSLKTYGAKAVWTGNPTRELLINNDELLISEIYEDFDLKKDLPVVLTMGGGTGSLAINELVWENLEELTKICQVIHSAGINKMANDKWQMTNDSYKNFEILDKSQLAKAYKIADVVVSRCGLGTLTELAGLGKPAILIPMPDTHQEDNAKVFSHAAIVLDQKKLSSASFRENIQKLLDDKDLQKKLSKDIQKIMKRGANQAIAQEARKIVNQA